MTLIALTDQSTWLGILKANHDHDFDLNLDRTGLRDELMFSDQQSFDNTPIDKSTTVTMTPDKYLHSGDKNLWT